MLCGAFIRHENVAVRQGWGGRVPDDRFSIAGESDDLDLEDHVLEDERDIPVHSLDDVMDRVEEELQVTERAILLHTVPGVVESRGERMLWVLEVRRVLHRKMRRTR